MIFSVCIPQERVRKYPVLHTRLSYLLFLHINELKEYKPELLDKQRILAITKSDLIDRDIEKELLPTLPKKIPHVFISSITGYGLKELKDMLWSALQS